MWLNPKRKEYNLEKSYVTIKDRDMRWKRIDNLDCSGRINFVTRGTMTDLLTCEEVPTNEKVEYDKVIS